MSLKPLYVDLDDVAADYYKATKDSNGNVLEQRMFDKDFFLNLEPIPGAKAAIFQLCKMGYDVWFLSQPFLPLPESYSQKAQWVQLHFPVLAHKLILTQDKGLHIGAYLIDDNADKWKTKFEKNGGEFIHFRYGGYNSYILQDPAKEWSRIVEMFKNKPL